MQKYIRNTGKSWTAAEKIQLKILAKKNTPTRIIGLKMGRTEAAIYAMAAQEKISLDPTNQSPYGTK